MVANQQEEEIIPIAVAQPVLPGELENQRANGNRCKAENQIPGPHTSLPGGGVLHQPAIEQTSAHGKQLCNGHNHLIPAAHNANHIHIGGAVHSANLLGEELFHQCGNGIYNENQAQRPQQMAKDKLLFGNGPGWLPGNP